MTDALYRCRIMHARTHPVRRRFVYRVFSLFLDIDRLDEAARGCGILSRNGFNVLSFYDSDHGRRDGSALRPWVEDCLMRAGVGERPDEIKLLCFPRLWGQVFNPLSIFYCYRRGQVSAVVYEVNNTFGETHAYVAAASGRQAVQRHRADKALYVSPLIEMKARYEFAVRAPGETLSIGIKESGPDGLILTAAQTGTRRALTTWEAVRAVAAHPLMTLKIVGAIHWEALGAWLRGARLQPRPLAPSAPVSVAAAIERELPGAPPPLALAAE